MAARRRSEALRATRFFRRGPRSRPRSTLDVDVAAVQDGGRGAGTYARCEGSARAARSDGAVGVKRRVCAHSDKAPRDWTAAQDAAGPGKHAATAGGAWARGHQRFVEGRARDGHQWKRWRRAECVHLLLCSSHLTRWLDRSSARDRRSGVQDGRRSTTVSAARGTLHVAAHFLLSRAD
jgi:hypothetical protein